MARKVVGVGSVGTRAWIVLMLGRDGDDPLLLQAKEAQASVLEPYLGKSAYNNHGQRVVEGQRLMQAESDILLGWLRTQGIDGVERDFYFRQLWDAKGSALVERHGADGDVGLREAVRLDAGEGARPLRRRDRDLGVHGHVGHASTSPWPCSRRSTPTRTSATTRRSRRPSTRAGWRRRPACTVRDAGQAPAPRIRPRLP